MKHFDMLYDKMVGLQKRFDAFASQNPIYALFVQKRDEKVNHIFVSEDETEENKQ